MQLHELFEISDSATAAEIEAAYDRQMSRWQPLLSHPVRGAEAEKMIARLDAARIAMLKRLDAGEGELRVDEGPTRFSVSSIDRSGNKDDGGNAIERERLIEIARLQQEREEQELKLLLTNWPKLLRSRLKAMSDTERKALRSRIRIYREKYQKPKPFLYQPNTVRALGFWGIFFPIPLWTLAGYILASDPEVNQSTRIGGLALMVIPVLIAVTSVIATVREF